MTRLAGWAVISLLVAAGCGDNTPAVRTASTITVTQGNGQPATAGMTLPVKIGFTVSDAQGPLAGVKVTFALGDPTGAIAVTNDTTNSSGVVLVTWTVGGTVGQQTLTASVTGVSPATATAAVAVGPVAIVSIQSQPSQFVVVGHPVASVPSVKVTDAFNNPIPGRTVTFTDLTGRTTVLGGSQVTDAAGKATAGGWTVPDLIGTYNLTITAGTVNSVVAAFAIPAAVRPNGGDNQSANTGTQLPVAPSVIAVDDANNPLAGARVAFTVTTGGGRLVGTAQVLTGSDGIATAPAWILGPAAGANTVTAEVSGVTPIVFTATGIAAAPAAVTAVGPTGFTSFQGNFTSSLPTVTVADAGGHPIAGLPVTFSVTSGGGIVRGTTVTTDFQGQAQLGSWRLGPTAGPQTVDATVTGITPLTFTATATAVPASQFGITVRFVGTPPTSSQQAAFDAAAARWARILLSKFSDEVFTPDISMAGCGETPLNETVHNLLIFAKVTTIDGVGGILGQAGPCYIRDGNNIPVVGYMEFDSADVAALQTAGQFDEVVLHEMGHVLGFGSIWEDLTPSLLDGAGGGNPTFNGPSARSAFTGSTTIGTNYSGTPVPVENTGGAGTRDAHWRESVLGNELMTGFLDNGANPLSAITVGSFRDEGYLADDTQADAFSFAAALRALSRPTVQLLERPWTLPIRTISRGVVKRTIFR